MVLLKGVLHDVLYTESNSLSEEQRTELLNVSTAVYHKVIHHGALDSESVLNNQIEHFQRLTHTISAQVC